MQAAQCSQKVKWLKKLSQKNLLKQKSAEVLHLKPPSIEETFFGASLDAAFLGSRI